MKTLFLIAACFSLTSTAQAGMTDLVGMGSCIPAAIGGVYVSAKVLDAMKVKNGAVEFVGIVGTSTAACAAATVATEPLGQYLDGIPSDSEMEKEE